MSGLKRFLRPADRRAGAELRRREAARQPPPRRHPSCSAICGGFTAFADTAEPEERVMAVLREYHGSLAGPDQQLRGHAWNASPATALDGPVQRPDPLPRPLRGAAVKMAVEMRDRVMVLTAGNGKKKLGHELGFGIGIAHGFATLGRISSEGRFDYTAIGPRGESRGAGCAARRKEKRPDPGRRQGAHRGRAADRVSKPVRASWNSRDSIAPVAAFDIRALRGLTLGTAGGT